MAKYTIELRTLLEKSNIDLGMQNYPLYTFQNIYQNNSDFGKDLKGQQITNFRDYLNNYIFQHFYFREIGAETGFRFSFILNRKMNEIMVYYNQMLKSLDINFNPLWNVDLTETFTHNISDTGLTNANSTGNDTVESHSSGNETNERTETLEQNTDNTNTINNTKTPNLTKDSIEANMSTAQAYMTAEQIREHAYLSSAKHNLDSETGTETETGTNTEVGNITNDNSINSTIENSSTLNQSNNSTNESTINNTNNRTETYTRKQEGSSAGYLFTQNIEQWRKIMINIPDMICKDLQECFMQIF